ncbi:hypothetical protein LOTGIDRAFT_188779 [Lottia gigantea]|uniref:GST N-terminal domain-containing protein n=1 Tax=Lottia gigantea TaxID=225164 RepID=V4AMX7_LOTGI|nr:hypothetical protein LOTGIDRAFT_188779 [Lottia gigantea]ESO94961.1 hypothetical protein LOTGIDRAFT_188779 [Lottia gigantea]
MKMAERLTLYYYPGSYFSQKALLALFEKNLQFNHHIIKLMEGGHIEPWYIKLNKNGKVPLLRDDETLVPDSENIISYLDQQFPAGSKLVPGNKPPEYDRLHQLLTDRISIQTLTYGTFINPDLSFSGLPPALIQPSDVIIGNFTRIVEKMQRLAEENPHLREEYLKKAEENKMFRDNAANKDKVQETLEMIHEVLDEVEKQLEISMKDNPGNWLFNKDYTSPDITLTVFLNRLKFLGQTKRYISDNKRPHVNRYWDRAQQRKSFLNFMELYTNFSKQ